MQSIVDSLVDLLRKENIAVHGMDKEVIVRALLFCQGSGHISFADAMVWAARSAAGTTRSPVTVYAFDQRFPSEDLDVRGG